MSPTKNILIPILGLLLLLWWNPAVAPSLHQQYNLPLAENQPPKTTLLAVGDIMLSRNVSAKIEKSRDPNLPFLHFKDALAAADITFGNLECPLDPGEYRIYEGLVFRCLTKDFEGVINAGFDVLSTANNHAFDQGLDNLEFTVDFLKSKNILAVGTTSSLSPPREGEIEEGVIERNGTKFGFLAYSYSAHNDGGKSVHPQIETMGTTNLESGISNLESLGADVIVVSMHAGIEYTRTPTQDQIDFAHAAVDAGANIVIGHHPHWIQPIEVYSPTTQLSPDSPLPSSPGEGRMPEGQERSNHKGLIFYSLGNFIFDQMWSQDTREGLMVEFEFHGKVLKQAKLIPIIIDDYCCPRLANEKEKIATFKKINVDFEIIRF